MRSQKSPLIDANELSKIEQPCIVIDARSGPDAFERFQRGHVQNAIHVDLDKDLSDKPVNAANGGRHPLPPIQSFGKFLGRLGITPDTNVIVYDDKNSANAAARFWWMLRAIGHLKVHVIDGGLDAIVRAKKSLSTEFKSPIPAAPYPVSEWQLPTVTIDQVADAAKDTDKLVIDVREAYRYRGEKEPIDLVAGHIPGAVNIPYINNLNEDGTFRSPQSLKSQYENAIANRRPENVIVHCGSGVTACHTLLALEHAGISGANLYVGSWSEWSRNERPIATGD